MKRLFRLPALFLASFFLLLVLPCSMTTAGTQSAETGASSPQRTDAPSAVDAERAALDAWKQQLDAREAALTAREQQIAAQTASLNNRSREQDAFRAAQKKLQSERAKKTLKIYRALKPAESAKLLDRLDEATAVEILNSLDQKTVTKLIPFLNQPRVIKWTKETLSGA